jgi:hypothetical protein
MQTHQFKIEKHSARSIFVSTLALLAILLMLGAIHANANMSSSPWAAEKMWGDGTLWQMMAPLGQGSNIPAEPLYIVAPQTSTPQAPADNDHLPGVAHDHVISVPPGNRGAYNANWNVYVVLCTPDAIMAGTCVPDWETFPGPSGPGTGPTLPLAQSINGQSITSDSVILSGIGSGEVVLHDTGINFVCVVQQIKS